MAALRSNLSPAVRPVLRWSTAALLLAGAGSTGCTAQGSRADTTDSAGERVPAAASDAPEEDLPAAVRAAVAALRAGDYTGASDLVDGLVFDDALARGRAALAGGSPRDALLPLDEALAVRPDDAGALFLRARAAFDAAAGDPQAGFFYGDAAAGFEAAARAGYGVEAALLASRAARLAGEGDSALALARQALGWIDARPERRAAVRAEQAPERTWAEAAFDAYVAARNGSPASAGEDARSLFAETEDALGRLAGQAPTDPWALQQLSNLLLWEGRSDEALEALEQALALDPAAPALHEALARQVGDRAAARAAAEGADEAAAQAARRAAILERYADFAAAYPDLAVGHWTLGFEGFYGALESFEEGARDEAAFRRAEQSFRRCRELDPEQAESCLGYEVMCRNGIGWCQYWRDDLEGAEQAFLSTEELLDRGLDWSLGERLPSALAGLDFVTRKYAARADDAEAMSKAASLADTMFARRPENANLANNAGFLNRDAGVLYERLSRRARAESMRADDAETAAAARAEAARLRQRAQTLMERSWAAYQVAAELAPDDVRVVNDAGLVQAYYLRSAPDQARAYFLDSVEDGAAQLQSTELDDDTRAALEEAWGDAHQNLAILTLATGGDLVSAREWLAEAIQIGPAGRGAEMTPMLTALDASIAAGARTPELEERLRRHVWSD